MNVDMERSKTISLDDLVKAAGKVWDEMPLVQILLRDLMFRSLISRLAVHLDLVDKVYDIEVEK